jgi:hypothetical protein
VSGPGEPCYQRDDSSPEHIIIHNATIYINCISGNIAARSVHAIHHDGRPDESER